MTAMMMRTTTTRTNEEDHIGLIDVTPAMRKMTKRGDVTTSATAKGTAIRALPDDTGTRTKKSRG